MTARDAVRTRARGWRDPRLVIGLIIVLVTTVAGAKIFASGDHTAGYWALAEPVKAGETVKEGDVTEVRARLSNDTEGQYLRSDEVAADELTSKVWNRDLSPGGLLPRDVIAGTDADDSSQLPLAVDEGAFPADLQRGDEVDVWVGPAEGDPLSDRSEPVLRGVKVLSVGEPDELGASGRTVLVEVGPDLAASVISAVGAGHVTVVRVRPWTS